MLAVSGSPNFFAQYTVILSDDSLFIASTVIVAFPFETPLIFPSFVQEITSGLLDDHSTGTYTPEVDVSNSICISLP